jgi:hypothetical protein
MLVGEKTTLGVECNASSYVIRRTYIRVCMLIGVQDYSRRLDERKNFAMPVSSHRRLKFKASQITHTPAEQTRGLVHFHIKRRYLPYGEMLH